MDPDCTPGCFPPCTAAELLLFPVHSQCVTRCVLGLRAPGGREQHGPDCRQVCSISKSTEHSGPLSTGQCTGTAGTKLCVAGAWGGGLPLPHAPSCPTSPGFPSHAQRCPASCRAQRCSAPGEHVTHLQTGHKDLILLSVFGLGYLPGTEERWPRVYKKGWRLGVTIDQVLGPVFQRWRRCRGPGNRGLGGGLEDIGGRSAWPRAVPPTSSIPCHAVEAEPAHMVCLLSSTWIV